MIFTTKNLFIEHNRLVLISLLGKYFLGHSLSLQLLNDGENDANNDNPDDFCHENKLRP